MSLAHRRITTFYVTNILE